MKRFLVVPGLALVLLFSFGCARGEEDAPPMPEEVLDAVEADPDHYPAEFENDVLQVIRIGYGSGEQSVMHSHPANCRVSLTDTMFTMTPQSGEPTTNEGTAGNVNCGDTVVHLPENVSGADAEIVMIALKGRETFDSGSAGPAVTGFSDVPDAVTADPEHYTVEFENDLLRVVRIRYGAGEASVMHAHPAGCAVSLAEQSVQFTLPDGTVEEALDQPGDVTCFDASVHLPENTGDTPSEVILVELKNRETF